MPSAADPRARGAARRLRIAAAVAALGALALAASAPAQTLPEPDIGSLERRVQRLETRPGGPPPSATLRELESDLDRAERAARLRPGPDDDRLRRLRRRFDALPGQAGGAGPDLSLPPPRTRLINPAIPETELGLDALSEPGPGEAEDRRGPGAPGTGPGPLGGGRSGDRGDGPAGGLGGGPGAGIDGALDRAPDAVPGPERGGSAGRELRP